MEKLVYVACFYPCESKPGYTVEVPDLPGCVTEGNSIENAIEMAIDCASGWILDAIESGENIPKASKMKDIKLEYDDGFCSYIILDIDEYERLHGNKSVKKTLSIPNWLNILAEKDNINFSHVLQQALKEKLQLKNS